jgi:hypothetical protein
MIIYMQVILFLRGIYFVLASSHPRTSLNHTYITCTHTGLAPPKRRPCRDRSRPLPLSTRNTRSTFSNIHMQHLQHTKYEKDRCNIQNMHMKHLKKQLKTIANIRNIQMKHLQHMCETYVTFR